MRSTNLCIFHIPCLQTLRQTRIRRARVSSPDTRCKHHVLEPGPPIEARLVQKLMLDVLVLGVDGTDQEEQPHLLPPQIPREILAQLGGQVRSVSVEFRCNGLKLRNGEIQRFKIKMDVLWQVIRSRLNFIQIRLQTDRVLFSIEG